MVDRSLPTRRCTTGLGFDPETLDWVFGLIAVVTVLEMTRRLMGLFFPIMAVCFILYALRGSAAGHLRSPGLCAQPL